ncbi:MAG: S-layer homology domain-containing protein [Nitriliruptoraceae bacterium]
MTPRTSGSSCRASLPALTCGVLIAALLASLLPLAPGPAIADTDHLQDAPRDGNSPPQGDGREPDGEVADPYGGYGSSTDDGGTVDTAQDDGEDEPTGDGDADDTGDGDDGGSDDGDDGGSDDGDDGGSGDGSDEGDDPEPSLEPDAIDLREEVVAAADYLPALRIHGSGWGHGVGMSQYGAYAMALEGHSAEEILTVYYDGTEVDETDRAERRIRVGLRTGEDESVLEAVDEPVVWRACGEPGEQPTSRVAQDDCEDWFEQPAGEVVRVVPASADDGDGGDGDGDDADAAVEVQRRVDGRFETWQQTDRPVARAVHGRDPIEAQSQDGQLREYRFGRRDFHLLDDGLSVVQDLSSVERYLRGLAEVPNSWGEDGPAALRAQAITGRSYAVRRLGSPRGGDCACDLLATPADQAFIGEDKVTSPSGELWAQAVADSAGEVLAADEGLAETYYSSSHGLGRSEHIQDSWAYGTDPVGYLSSIEDPWSAHPDAGNPRASWLATADNRTAAQFLSAGRETTLARVERIEVLSRTDGATPREVAVTGVNTDGERERFELAGRPDDPKPITGASMRRYLPIEVGGSGGRLYSSQIERFTFGRFDDDDGHVHELAISWAEGAGVVSGFEDDTFRPDRRVSRAQIATYLVNTFDITTGEPQGRFDDVGADHAHAANIEAIADAEVAEGYGDGTFRPDEPVSRAQMASLLARALALSTDATGSFDDVDEDDVHAANIEAIAADGVTQGCAEQRFCPQDPVSRGQLASFVHRIVVGAVS